MGDDMEDTSGFYKREDDALLYGPHGVLGPEYELTRETRHSNVYPVDGWSWYDSEDAARADLGLPSRAQEALNALLAGQSQALDG
jgi:hypothetical protein